MLIISYVSGTKALSGSSKIRILLIRHSNFHVIYRFSPLSQNFLQGFFHYYCYFVKLLYNFVIYLFDDMTVHEKRVMSSTTKSDCYLC